MTTFFELLNNFGEDKAPVIEIPGSAIKKMWPVLNVIFKYTLNHKKNELSPIKPSVSPLSAHAETSSSELTLSSDLSPSHLTITKGTALILSLFGWRLGTDTIPTIHCDLCLRTLGLWNFRKLRAEQGCKKLETGGSDRVFEDCNSYSLDYKDDDSGKTTVPESATATSDGASETSTLLICKPPLEPKEDVKYGNPDIFLPMLYKEDDDSRSVDSKTTEPENSSKTCQTPTENDVASTPDDSNDCSSPSEASDTQIEFKTPSKPSEPSTRVLRSRSIGTPGKTPRNKRKRSSPTEKSPPPSPKLTKSSKSPRRVTRSSSESTQESPGGSRTRSGESPNLTRKTRSSIEFCPGSAQKTKSNESLKTIKQVEALQPDNKKPSNENKQTDTQTHKQKNKQTNKETKHVMCAPQQPLKKKSKLEMVECVVKEVMSREPSQLNLSVANPGKLDVVKQHHYWCPWVCRLPSYRVSNKNTTRVSSSSPGKPSPGGSGDDRTHSTSYNKKQESSVRVSLVEQTDSPGWETLFHHLITDNKTPGNAWIAVHNMLQDCVSRRLS